MKFLTPPENDDEFELLELSKNQRLSSYPLLANYLPLMGALYAQYISSDGNPWKIKPCHMADELKVSLRSHYTNEIKERLSFLSYYRNRLSPRVCLMCGGYGAGTLDHYLPKNEYPEFSIFSKNLVPACSCNTRRREIVKGDNTNQRIIHPYYDDFNDIRLYKIVFLGSLEDPVIDIDVIDKDHDQSELIKFHMEEVLIKNKIIYWMIDLWSNLSTVPNNPLMVNIRFDRLKVIDLPRLKREIKRLLDISDGSVGTKNSWNSIFYYGLLEDEERLKKLLPIINSMI